MRSSLVKSTQCLAIANQEFRICKQTLNSIQPIPCDAMRFLMYTDCMKEYQTHKMDTKK